MGAGGYKPVILKPVNEEKKKKQERIKGKVVALGKMQNLFKTKRVKNESMVQTKVGADKIDTQEVQKRRESLTTKDEHFEAAKDLDTKNENRQGAEAKVDEEAKAEETA